MAPAGANSSCWELGSFGGAAALMDDNAIVCSALFGFLQNLALSLNGSGSRLS